jgi:hypothetical protein
MATNRLVAPIEVLARKVPSIVTIRKALATFGTEKVVM